MTKLTTDNYFSLNNRVLTRSKIRDFLVDKSYFYKLHITGEVEKEGKNAFMVGNIVDELLTMLDNKDQYIVINYDMRTKAGKEAKAEALEQGYKVINNADYNFIFGIAGAVEETDAYKMIIKEKYEKQVILQMPADLGKHFDTFAIMIDFIKFDGDTCTIIDLKTTKSIDDNKFYYSALDYWYFMQMAIATYIIRRTRPEIKKFTYYDLAVEKTKDIYPVKLFQLANSKVEKCEAEIDNLLEKIRLEKDFKKFNPSINNAILIGETSEDF